MKKITILLLTLLLINPLNVEAIDYDESLGFTNDYGSPGDTFKQSKKSKCVQNGNCLLLCAYNSTAIHNAGDPRTSVEVYYYYDGRYDNYEGRWYVRFQAFALPQYVSTMVNDGEEFYASERVVKETFTKGGCPSKAYFETNGENQVCFINGSVDCAKRDDFKTGKGPLVFNFEKKIEDFVSKLAPKAAEVTCEAALADGASATDKAMEIIDASSFNEGFFAGKDIPKIFYDKDTKTPKNNGLKKGINKISEEYKKKFDSCKKEEEKKLEEKLDSGEITQEEFETETKELNNKEQELEDEIKKNKTSLKTVEPTIKVNVNVDTSGCGLISEDLREWLQWLLDTIRIAGVVLAIVMGIMDYTKASFASKEDAMKEANKNFTTRLLALALLLLVPTIINLALSIFDVGIYEEADEITCGIK